MVDGGWWMVHQPASSSFASVTASPQNPQQATTGQATEAQYQCAKRNVVVTNTRIPALRA